MLIINVVLQLRDNLKSMVYIILNMLRSHDAIDEAFAT